jgi:hypothetical protein
MDFAPARIIQGAPSLTHRGVVQFPTASPSNNDPILTFRQTETGDPSHPSSTQTSTPQSRRSQHNLRREFIAYPGRFDVVPGTYSPL